ncbi:MAG: UDP pyrophosphate phosphatase, partial [Tenericutes bacterium]|nr:UDP pyrophosphate phosphatase [Mycoplasmatota bacterium]
NSSILGDLNFEIVVNFGSLIAVLLIYWKDMIKLINNFFKYLKTKNSEYKSDYIYCWLIVLGCIPVGIAGFLLKDYIENVLNKSTIIIGISFIITAVFLFIVRKVRGTKEDKDISWKDALFIGMIQIIALIPGISRSGTTLIAALHRDIKRSPALKYSFMLYIPISLGTMILGVKDMMETPNMNSYILPYTLGFIASFIVSYYTLRWFKGVVQKGRLAYFSIYCLILGILVILFL